MGKSITVHVSVNAIIIFEKQILLLQMNRPEEKRGRWGLPGGKVENGETFEQAMIREIKEETGIEESQYSFEKLDIIHDKPSSPCKHIYLVKLKTRVDTINFHPAEIIQAQWVVPSTLNLEKIAFRGRWILPLLLHCQKEYLVA